MFVYISFLRPPPLQSATSGVVSVTPQISNDLRTELFQRSQDIFYTWALVQNSHQDEIFAKPKKLTTWRQSNAYKEIQVPLPPSLRGGQSWRLLLSAKPHIEGAPHFSTVDLYDQSLGTVPFPVISMPILFGLKGAKRDGKQEKVERVYRLQADEVGPLLRIMEQTSFDLDKKIWDSGVGLSSWLVGLENESVPADDGLAILKNALFLVQQRNILELGAGTGIVALTLAALISIKSMSSRGYSHIITTDLESAMPLLEHNISTNAHLFQDTRPTAVVLDWDNETLPDSIQDFNEGFDVIVMADVTYNTASFPSLVRTLAQVMRLGTKPPMVLMGYKQRDAAERTLWNLVAEIGLELKKISEHKGAGGAPVEIWLGCATTRPTETKEKCALQGETSEHAV